MKTAPSNAAAERSLIASCFYDHLAFPEVDGIIGPESFYQGSLGRVWSYFRELHGSGKPIDAVLLAQRAKEAQDPEITQDFVAEIMQFEYGGSNAAYYAEIVAALAARRSLWSTASEAQRLAMDESVDIGTIEKLLADGLTSATKSRLAPDRTLTQVLSEYFADVLSKDGKRKDECLATPWWTLTDALEGGFRPGQLVYIAAPASMGKTSFMLNIATHTAVDDHKPVMIVSLETSGDIVAGMIVSAQSRVPMFHQKKNAMSQDDRTKLMDVAAKLSGSPMRIHDSGGMTIAEVRSACRRAHLIQPLSMIAVDYVQLIGAGITKENRNAEVTHISGQLKAMAKELKCPVLACAQINREAVKRVEKRPNLFDLRDSGSLEQDADIVIFIHRDAYYDTPKPGDAAPDAAQQAKKKEAEVIIAKQKIGRRNMSLPFVFDDMLFRFDMRDPFAKEQR